MSVSKVSNETIRMTQQKSRCSDGSVDSSEAEGIAIDYVSDTKTSAIASAVFL